MGIRYAVANSQAFRVAAKNILEIFPGSNKITIVNVGFDNLQTHIQFHIQRKGCRICQLNHRLYGIACLDGPPQLFQTTVQYLRLVQRRFSQIASAGYRDNHDQFFIQHVHITHQTEKVVMDIVNILIACCL